MNSQTTHADRVAGWIVVGLFVSVVVSMGLVAFCPGLSAISQSQLLGISTTCVGALAGSLTLRRAAPQPDSSQQVTIPSGDPDQPAIVISSATGQGSGTPPGAQSPPASPAPQSPPDQGAG